MMNQPERSSSHRPLDTFRSQARQCQQVLVEEQEMLSVFPQQFAEEDLITAHKALCNETLSHLARSREALQTLQICFDETNRLPLVLPLCYILPTNIRYTLSCMAAFEKDLRAYHATRRSSLAKRAALVKGIESHFHTLFFNLEELLSNLCVCLDQSYFEENAVLDRHTCRLKTADQRPGQIIPLYPSSSAHSRAERELF